MVAYIDVTLPVENVVQLDSKISILTQSDGNELNTDKNQAEKARREMRASSHFCLDQRKALLAESEPPIYWAEDQSVMVTIVRSHLTDMFFIIKG